MPLMIAPTGLAGLGSDHPVYRVRWHGASFGAGCRADNPRPGLQTTVETTRIDSIMAGIVFQMALNAIEID